MSHPVFTLPDGQVRSLGRDTRATQDNWQKVISLVPVAPRIFGGAVPDQSPNIRRFDHKTLLDQRSRGFCTGFNTCSALMLRLRIPQGATAEMGEPLPTIRLSPLYTYDVGRMEAKQEGIDLGMGDGGLGSCTMRGAQRYGSVRIEVYDSTPGAIDRHHNNTRPAPFVVAQGIQHPAKQIAIADSFEHGLELMGAGLPVTFASDIPEGMMKTDQDGFFRMTGSIVGGHLYMGVDYNKTENWILIRQSWAAWGEQTSDPEYAKMGGFTQIGKTPLDEFEKWFSPSLMASGASEICVANTVVGWDAPIVDYSSM